MLDIAQTIGLTIGLWTLLYLIIKTRDLMSRVHELECQIIRTKIDALHQGGI